MLRFLVEESIRNGFAPISQRLIATHGLGFDDDFNPTKSADVRVKVARLRRAIDRYYDAAGRGNPVVLAISSGPYRLIATENGLANDSWEGAVEARRRRPMLVLVEPEVNGMRQGHDSLAGGVGLRLVSLLVDSPFVTVSGPLSRDRLSAAAESAASLAGRLGYDYAAQPEIHIADPKWRVRMTVTDTQLGKLAAKFEQAFVPPDPPAIIPAAEAIASLLFHRIGEVFSGRG